MTTQHNAAFNELIFNTVSEAARVSNTEAAFEHQFEGTTADPIAVVGERDNDIYNLGVHEGAVAVLDGIHKAGYSIHDPEGVKLVPTEDGSFTKDYYSRKYWEAVSN